MDKKGKVYLVGAGPGDPSLFTLKGKNVLSKADVIIYDHLSNPYLLRYAKKDAKIIYAGKEAGKHILKQDEINRLLVEFSKKGLNVVRLKGGDPFIFGRGAEEALELVKEGIEFEIIPGITSVIAVPAYAGIPLTHREYASSVVIVTGHEADSKERHIMWEKISGAETIVILMGASRIRNIKEKLIDSGLSEDTHFAIISNGTLPEQKIVKGKLRDMDKIAKGIKPPAVIVLGKVVDLSEEISWFEKKPLFGKKILITRAKEQAYELAEPLMDMGADCIIFPTIEIRPPESWDSLDNAIKEIKKYDWIIFTSVNGVNAFFNRLRYIGKDLRQLHNIKIGAIGAKTALLLNDMFIKPDLIPEEYRAEGIAKYFEDMDIKGMRFLIPRADIARDYLPERLKKKGAMVNVVPAYRNAIPEVKEEEVKNIKEKLLQGEIELAIFTSPSTFKNLLYMLNITKQEVKRYFHKTKIACIGPVTEKVIRETGLSVHIIPDKYTISHLIKSVLKYFA